MNEVIRLKKNRDKKKNDSIIQEPRIDSNEDLNDNNNLE